MRGSLSRLHEPAPSAPEKFSKPHPSTMDAALIVARHGGALDRRRLLELGATDHDLRRALKSGTLNRPRRGWYSTWPEGDPRFRAMRVGGRLTGISAIAAWGGWVLGEHPVHVAVPTNAARLRTQWRRDHRRTDAQPDGAVVHWVAPTHDRGSSTGVVDLLEALELVCRVEPLEQAVAAIDWALTTGRIDRIDRAALAQRMGHIGPLVDLADERCESLPESLARSRLRATGLHVHTQVRWKGGLERIDLVIEGVVALEVDGEQFHRDTFEEDRWRDLELTDAGYHALRPSARQVFRRWRVVQAAVERALQARGIHVLLHNSGVKALRQPATRRWAAQHAAARTPTPELWR